MTVKEFLAASQPQISPHSTHPQRDLRDFLEIVINVPTAELIAHPKRRLSPDEQNQLNTLIKRQTDGEPHQQITGFTEFCGHRIDINKDVLIPRPETEQLAEMVIAEFANLEQVEILEIGVGSGCIASSLLYVLKKSGKHFGFTGIDPSHDAISTTKHNIESITGEIDERIRLKQIGINDLEPIDSLDIVVSNPPYLTDQEMSKLPKSVSDFEPHLALHGGEQGVDIYLHIRDYLGKLPKLPQLFLEISPQVSDKTQQIFSEIYVPGEVRIAKDLFGEERFLIAG